MEAKQAPLLLQFLFGEAAEAAQQGASQRLRRWCTAFEGWLAERRGHLTRSTHKQALLAWRRLLGQQRKAPWELTAEDLAQHAAWMEAEGYSPTTIANAIGIFQNFYRWCGERKVDPACGAGFNPAAGVQRPKILRYAGTKLLSRGEAQALLDLLRRDPTPLGKRDYAFFLARLRTGVPLSSLQRLQWGQIEQDEGGAWVRWRPEAERNRLPGEVWEAALASLEASGRLAEMEAGKYLFAPLAEPGKEETGGKAEDWAEGRCLSTSQILANLKLYGRPAGIAEEKLTLMALRRTATRLKLEEEGNVEKMKTFLDSQEETKSTKYRLKRLPEIPGEEGDRGGEGQEGKQAAHLPNRKARPFRPGEGTTHGLYARSQPAEGVAAVLAENIQGLEEEIVGMRTLARRLLERQGQARNSAEAARLGEAYTLMASRLAEMKQAEKKLAGGGKADTSAEDTLARLDAMMIEMGLGPVGDAARAEALGGMPELEASDRRLAEEVATIRLVLRRTFALAMEAQETREYIHMTEVYSIGCVRLVRLLRVEGSDENRLTAYVREQIDLAIKEITEEFGLWI